jgi:hypothetical protein
MNWKTILIIIVLAFVLALLDVSFLGAITIGGATIISTFVVVIVFAILNKLDATILFAAAAALFFTILSSVPLWIIFLGFFVIPGIVIYLRRTNLPEPNVAVSFFYFIISTLIFELLFLINFREFNLVGFNLTGAFVLINSLAGVIAYYFAKRFSKRTHRIKQ